MEFRQSTKEDIKFVTENPLYESSGKEVDDVVDYMYTLDHGDYILGIGGFRMITNTTAWAWIELTRYVGSHIIPTYRVINEYMEIFCKTNKICRLQAWVDKEFDEGIRTVQHMGFEKESIMRDFLGHGRDALLYVKYFNGAA